MRTRLDVESSTLESRTLGSLLNVQVNDRHTIERDAFNGCILKFSNPALNLRLPNLRTALRLHKEVLSVCLAHCLLLLDGAELEEVRGAVHLVVVLLGWRQAQAVLHARAVAHAHEVVVPAARVGDHVEAQEAVAEKHLHTQTPQRLDKRISSALQVATMYPMSHIGAPNANGFDAHGEHKVRKKDSCQYTTSRDRLHLIARHSQTCNTGGAAGTLHGR